MSLKTFINGTWKQIVQYIPKASDALPQAAGEASAGTSEDYARADHVHPHGDVAGVVSTIIYPNGGTAEAPANVSVNQRYEMDNPYPGYFVQCEAQVQNNGIWGCPNFVYVSGYGGVGITCYQLSTGKLVVQSGNMAVLSNVGANAGTPFGNIEQKNTAPCRVIVTRLGKMPS